MAHIARWILGYHGCTQDLANELITGARPISAWPQSNNSYDWLGLGIYFWEHGPERARRWAQDKLQLEQQEAETGGRSLPLNPGRDADLGGRYLDCLVVNRCLRAFPEFEAVRGAFQEGEPAFPGAKIFRESHIQIAVRDPSYILGVFRPT